MFLFRFIIFSVVFLLVTLSAWSQDAIIKADLKHKKLLRDAFYIDQHGLWIAGAQAQTAIGSGRRWNVSIQKFAPDLSKKEWEVDMQTEEFYYFVYNPKNPVYLYIRTFDDKYRNIGNRSYNRFITQIDTTGKVITKDLSKDESPDEELFFFCDDNYYYEVWAKKKSSDLILIKYDHATLTPTRFTLPMPALEKKKETQRVWSYGGKTDSTITLLQHNEEYNKTKIRVLTINISSGASSEFYYEPGLENINISPFATDRFRDGVGGNWGEIGITSYAGGSYPWTAYGNIVPIEGETGYYFYALGSFTNKKANDPRPDGFILTKLDAEGREVWSIKQEIKEEEVDNTFYRNHKVPGAMVIYLNQFKEEQALGIEITYQKTDVVMALSTLGQGRIGYKYNQNGKLLEQCLKNTKQRVMTGKSLVAQPEDLMPCFSQEKTKRVVDYLDTKKPEGSFSVVAGKNAHVLVILPKQEKEPTQCLYFKN